MQSTLTQKDIWRLWTPLLATWLMMATEGPVVAAMIARLPDPTLNLAAYGVSFAFALILEAPVIMLTSAATTLVRDRASYHSLRRYAYSLNVAVTLLALLFLWRPLFGLIVERVIELPSDLAERIHRAVWLLLPWPAAIGFRRFFQGIIIYAGSTRHVMAGTVVRLSTMVGSCLLLAMMTQWDGAAVGAAALSLGVVAEAVAVRWLARAAVAKVLLKTSQQPVLSLRRFTTFYYPLALTSLMSLAVQPSVTFFVGRAQLPIESLAVLPVINSLTFIFRCVSLSLQEVAVALLGAAAAAREALKIFMGRIGLGVICILSLIAYTPLSSQWFVQVAGLSPELAALAVVPLRIAALIPCASMVLSYFTAVAIHAHRTKPVTAATATEVAAIVASLSAGVHLLHLTGATAAVLALATGRIISASLLALAHRPAPAVYLKEPLI